MMRLHIAGQADQTLAVDLSSQQPEMLVAAVGDILRRHLHGAQQQQLAIFHEEQDRQDKAWDKAYDTKHSRSRTVQWEELLGVVMVNTESAGSLSWADNAGRVRAVLGKLLRVARSGRPQLHVYSMCPSGLMPQRDGLCRLCARNGCSDHRFHWGLSRVRVATCTHHGKTRQSNSPCEWCLLVGWISTQYQCSPLGV